jgi:hypothetical protein
VNDAPLQGERAAGDALAGEADEEAPEGGFTARAVGESIFTEADDLEQLHERAREAVRCQFDEGKAPKLIRLHC